MASNGLDTKAKNGTCRMCQRVRNTEKHLKVVGEVRHGFATGHIWECKNIEECDKTIYQKLKVVNKVVGQAKIENALKIGRFTEYTIVL